MFRDRILPWYCAATVLFLLLDYGFGLNVRIASLEPFPAARMGYYLVCFACLALMLWRPAWTTLIGTFESLVTLVALIFSMALRVMIPNDAIFEESVGFVGYQEIVNFLIAGLIAYSSWTTGLKRLRRL